MFGGSSSDDGPGGAKSTGASPAADTVDEASAESFPASDPPAWIIVHPGPPVKPLPDPADSDQTGAN